MDGGRSRGAADKDDRIRILEFQVDHLRAELESLKARHEEAVYSVAWHFAWPVRVVERAIRHALAGADRNNDDNGGAGAACPHDAGPQSQARPPEPLTRARIEARIARRIARPA